MKWSQSTSLCRSVLEPQPVKGFARSFCVASNSPETRNIRGEREKESERESRPGGSGCTRQDVSTGKKPAESLEKNTFTVTSETTTQCKVNIFEKVFPAQLI